MPRWRQLAAVVVHRAVTCPRLRATLFAFAVSS